MRRSAVATLVLAPLLIIAGFLLTILLLLQPPTSSACATAGEPGAPVVGSLGGVSGSGITQDELAAVRASALAGSTFSAGIFHSTAYGPPWGIDPRSGVDQGAGIATAAGVLLHGAAPRKYIVATDTALISSGQWLYIWPNPFGWRGPFLAADTGGAINGRDIDFYDWRGRNYQLRWNKPVDVRRAPSSPLGPGPADMTPPDTAPPLATAPTSAAPADSGPVLNVGDFLAPGTGRALERKLTGRSVRTLAARTRTSSQGLSILRSIPTLPSTIVVELGTNDSNPSTFGASIRSVLALARAASATVWWVNISRPMLDGTSASELNDVLTAEAARHPNLKVIDWNAAVAGGSVELFDDVHPTADGYKTRAALIADALTAPPAGGAGATAAGDCASAAPGSLGELTGTPQEIVDGVVAYAHDHGFPAISADTVRLANAAHSLTTTSGTISDHKGPPGRAWAADISNASAPTAEMDALARTIANAFNIPWHGSGLVSRTTNAYRMQLIYRTNEGGNHFNHVHWGVKRVG